MGFHVLHSTYSTNSDVRCFIRLGCHRQSGLKSPGYGGDRARRGVYYTEAGGKWCLSPTHRCPSVGFQASVSCTCLETVNETKEDRVPQRSQQSSLCFLMYSVWRVNAYSMLCFWSCFWSILLGARRCKGYSGLQKSKLLGQTIGCQAEKTTNDS